MCGRYTLREVRQVFEWMGLPLPEELRPRYNIAPTQTILVLREGRELRPMRWGLRPAWGKGTSKLLVNARSESAREKRSLREATARRRCLVPADGFYEWNQRDGRPYFVTLRGGAPFAIGGIWEAAEEGLRCCLLTTASNAGLEPIHGRMPVIVRQEDWEEWLAPHELAEEPFRRVVAPYDAEEMSIRAVSPLVNSARIDDARCCEAEEARRAEPTKVKVAPRIPDGQQTFGF